MSREQKPVNRPAYDKLTRLESSIAEVLRRHDPTELGSANNSAENELWLDLVDDFNEMLGTNKPRFDEAMFLGHCYGTNNYHVQEVSKEPLAR